MKKLLLLVALIALCCNDVHSQLYMIEKISLPATGEEFGIYADINVKESLSIFYDLQAPDPSQRARAKLTSLNLDNFISSLQHAKNIFVKWTKTAQEKKLSLISKRIPSTFMDQTLFFTQDGTWYSEQGVDIWAMFVVDFSGTCSFVLQTDYMTSEQKVGESSSRGLTFAGLFYRNGLTALSSSNTDITVGRYCGGSSLTFRSESEIDEFIAKLNAVRDWKKQNVSDGKLLK